MRCCTSPAARHSVYIFNRGSPDITLVGLPHSESQGSSLACSSPRTFRRSPRPSSAFSAWASTSYSLSLVWSSLRTLAHALFWRRKRTRRSKLLCLSLVLCGLFALRKIEVIVLYSVVNALPSFDAPVCCHNFLSLSTVFAPISAQ